MTFIFSQKWGVARILNLIKQNISNNTELGTAHPKLVSIVKTPTQCQWYLSFYGSKFNHTTHFLNKNIFLTIFSWIYIFLLYFLCHTTKMQQQIKFWQVLTQSTLTCFFLIRLHLLLLSLPVLPAGHCWYWSSHFWGKAACKYYKSRFSPILDPLTPK